MQETRPNRQQILEMMNGFRPAFVLGAAAELDVWTTLGDHALLAGQLAEKLHCDPRATAMLLDALAALAAPGKKRGAIHRLAGTERLADRRRPRDDPAHAQTRHEHLAHLVAVGLGGEVGRSTAQAQ